MKNILSIMFLTVLFVCGCQSIGSGTAKTVKMEIHDVNSTLLGNGLRVVHVPSPGDGMVYVNVLYGVGARNEDFSHTGIAHLLEHLMFDGTKAVPSFDEPLECAGGENNAFTTNDFTCYYISLPKQNAELAFWIESDRMRNLTFEKKKVDVLKKQRKALQQYLLNGIVRVK